MLGPLINLRIQMNAGLFKFNLGYLKAFKRMLFLHSNECCLFKFNFGRKCVYSMAFKRMLGLFICLCFQMNAAFHYWCSNGSLSFLFDGFSSPLPLMLLLTLNVNGLRCANKRLSFIHWLHSLNHDFICLQQLHFSDDAELLSWFSSFGFSIISSPGSVKSAGVAILYRPRFTLSNSWKDDSGRFIMGEFKVNDSVFRVANIYAPNRNPSRNLFFEDISVLDPSVSTLLANDFNSVLDRSLDRRVSSSSSSSSRESSDVISKLFSDLCVTDAWRHFHPDESSSWTRPDGVYASRIDLIGCPSDWLPFASASSIFPCPYSDNDVVSLTFSIPASYSRGPGCSL